MPWREPHWTAPVCAWQGVGDGACWAALACAQPRQPWLEKFVVAPFLPLLEQCCPRECAYPCERSGPCVAAKLSAGTDGV